MVFQEADGTVQFSFLRPHAELVAVSGDFNGWHKTSMPMSRDRDGWWRIRFRMAPGTYQFRYLSDGQWFTDYAAFGLERGPFGWNSVLKVDPPAARPRAMCFELPEASLSTHDPEVYDRRLGRPAAGADVSGCEAARASLDGTGRGQ